MEQISIITSVVVVLGFLALVCMPMFIFIKAAKSLHGRLRNVWVGAGAWIVYMILFVLVGALLLMTGILETQLSGGSMDTTYVTLETSIQAVYRSLIAFGILYGCIRLFYAKKEKATMGDVWFFAGAYGLITLVEPIRRFAISIYVLIQDMRGNTVEVALQSNGDLAQRISNSVLATDGAALSLFMQVFSYLCWMAMIVAIGVLIYTAIQQEEKWQLIVAFLAKCLFRVVWNLAGMEVAPWYWGNDGLVIVSQGIIAIVTCILAYKTYGDYYIEKTEEAE